MNREESGWKSSAWAALAVTGSALAALYYFHFVFGAFFPNNSGKIGVDYTYFAPRLLDGEYWFHANGPWQAPWFTPSFCGGLPSLGNPQSMYYSVPQALSIMFGPFYAIYYTFLIFALAGFVGFYLLLKGPFGVSRPLALLGGALFMFNGFYSYRMLVGHLAFHAWQLAPLACYFLLRPLPAPGAGRWRRFVFDSVAAAALFAMMIYSGMLELGLPMGLMVTLVAALHGVFVGASRDFWGRFILASLIALSLGAARLNATLAFMAQFERSMYDFPGALNSLIQVAWLLGQTIFFWPDRMLIHGARFWIGSKSFFHDRQCYEFSVTVVPLLLGAPALYALVKSGSARQALVRRGLAPTLNITLAILSVLVVVSLLYTSPTPRWGEFLKQVPIIKTYFNLTPWISVLIPAAIIAPLALFDRVVGSRGPALLALIVLCLLVAGAQTWRRDKSFYHGPFYDISRIEAAHAALAAGGGAPLVERMVDQSESDWNHALQKKVPMGGDDYLASGGSQINCYEPIFGYKMERFPQGALKPGPAMDQMDGYLNIKNPACYAYPAENSCSPGDHFKAEQRQMAENFRGYKPFEFKIPLRQKAANWLSLAALALILAYSAYYIIWVSAPGGWSREKNSEKRIDT